MGASLGGFLFGALLVVALTERRRLSAPAFRTERRQARRMSPAEWDRVLPPARSALRARWENSGEISEDDDWLAALAILVVSVLLAVAWVFTRSGLAPFAAYAVAGAAVAMVGYGALAWAQRHNLPPDARHVIVRTFVVVVLALVIIAMTWHATYRGRSLEDVRQVVLAVNTTRRPGMLTDTFHASGWGLTASVVLARALAIGLICRALLDLTAMAAAVRLAEGSPRAFPAWLAQFYPRRPIRRAVSVLAIATIAFILGSALGLRWWDEIQGERPSLPVPPAASTTVP